MKANTVTMDWRTFVRHTAGGRIPLELVDGINGGASWGDLQVELLESGEVCILARLLYGKAPTIGKKFTHDPENPDEAVSQAKAWLISARKPRGIPPFRYPGEGSGVVLTQEQIDKRKG